MNISAGKRKIRHEYIDEYVKIMKENFAESTAEARVDINKVESSS